MANRTRFKTPRDRLAALREAGPGGCILYTGPANRNGYGIINTPDGSRLAHRVAWEIERGPIPRGMQIDHQCRVKMCFNLEHLRLVTPGQNMQNHSGKPHHADSASGVRGVIWSSRRRKWQACVYRARKVVYLEHFETVEEAAAAVKAARLALFTHNDIDRRSLDPCPMQ